MALCCVQMCYVRLNICEQYGEIIKIMFVKFDEHFIIINNRNISITMSIYVYVYIIPIKISTIIYITFNQEIIIYIFFRYKCNNQFLKDFRFFRYQKYWNISEYELQKMYPSGLYKMCQLFVKKQSVLNQSKCPESIQ